MGSTATPTKDATEVRRDAVATAALTLVRRALVEGTQVTREALVQETSVTLHADEHDALRELDAEAQRLGVSALS
jgi:hypothetical protein